MEVKIMNSVGEISREVVGMILGLLKIKKDACFCLAAGHTSLPIFSEMIRAQREGKADFSQARFVGMDEWGGLGRGDDGSMAEFMYEHLFSPLGIREEQILFFDGRAALEGEAKRINTYLAASGGIDFMLLGLGMNGHLALNEPGVPFTLDCHVVRVDPTTASVAQKYFRRQHKLKKGVTIGMQTIADAGQRVLIVTGEQKRAIAERFISSPVTATLPATFLMTLPESVVFLDKEAAGDSFAAAEPVKQRIIIP
ncbi:MAG TPA: glucosamine-6-phosphate deaminase [Anaerovoracaceae bacterium]|nr:glucosamine-6-phosphate deaminase [Anaerovoracaceae bacterium]